ncbi:hypothetical protein OPV22_033330 [Ensete ventricosum]|uniref:DUF630 domain-containing protein n=1 Tax=Ensete ventricosum TaxID=4639 RepID=A0AAV8PME8_ENSVE|nr:hypothetical protein OPV22_033330 [Ensete ventricosum]
MGCTYSRVEVDEVVWRCKERRRLMKQLLSCRAELAAAHMAYLKSLRNTGATLLQFTEVETMILGDASPLHPHRRLCHPRRRPLPTLVPLPRRRRWRRRFLSRIRIIWMTTGAAGRLALPSLDQSGSYGIRLSLRLPRVLHLQCLKGIKDPSRRLAAVDEEDWAETKSEFEEEEEEEEKVIQRKEDFAVTVDPAREKCPLKELADDNSSAVSWLTKDTDMGMVVWRSKRDYKRGG